MTADHTPGRGHRLIETALYNPKNPGPFNEDEIEAGANIEIRNLVRKQTYKGLVGFFRGVRFDLGTILRARSEAETFSDNNNLKVKSEGKIIMSIAEALEHTIGHTHKCQITVDASEIVDISGGNRVNEGYASREERRRHSPATFNPSNYPSYQPSDADKKGLEFFKRLRACLLRKS